MKLKEIKRGAWYETKQGFIGKAVTVGGNFPVSVMLEVVAPYPRGRVHFAPRDVVREVTDPSPDKGELPEGPHPFKPSPNWGDCCDVCGEGELAHEVES